MTFFSTDILQPLVEESGEQTSLPATTPTPIAQDPNAGPMDFRQHIIQINTPIKTALAQLDKLAADAILFVVNEDEELVGSLTDGDVRRGFLKGLSLDDMIDKFLQTNPKSLQKGAYTIEQVINFRENDYKIVPVICREGKIVNVLNFRFLKSYLPVDAIIMAGGRGQRLSPLTDTTPKPLLKVGGESIIEHNINRLAAFGIDEFRISVGYKGEQIEAEIGNGFNRNINIQYIHEKEPLGTIGAVSIITDFQHEYLLVTNSDVLTNINYEHFFLHFLSQNADLAVVTIPYKVTIPYAVLEIENNDITSFKEKPSFTYYTNGGIYLMKRAVLEHLPQNTYFDATDLAEKLIALGKKVVSYPLAGYWLDIGRPEDYEKAQQDIHQIKF